jgi:hypothetical protein
MALTPHRWVATVLLGCLALAVALLPPEGASVVGLSRILGAAGWYYRTDWFEGDPAGLRRRHLGQAIARTEERLHVMQMRDSISRRLGSARSAVSVVALPGVPSGSHSRASMFRDELENRLGVQGASRVRVVLALEATENAWAQQQLLFLPGAVADDACAVVIRKKAVTRSDLDQVVSPCMFYASFGIPGDAIERWLVSRGFDVAREHSWWAPAVLSAQGTVDVGWWRSRLLSAAMGLDDPGLTNVQRVACQGGREEACGRMLLDQRRFWRPPEVGPRSYTLYPASRWYEAENAARDGMLAELVREFGPDRFARFWRSERKVEEAFAEAFGEPFDLWVRDWTQRRLGITYLGPVVRWTGVFGWLGVWVLATALSAILATRRQVT